MININPIYDPVASIMVYYLPLIDFVHFTSVSKEWRLKCDDQQVWKRMLARDFPNHKYIGYKAREEYQWMKKTSKEAIEKKLKEIVKRNSDQIQRILVYND